MLLPSLPDDARVWSFAAPRALSPTEQMALLADVRRFAAGWSSHGRAVEGVADLVLDRVLVVGAHLTPGELNAGVSGCGIDAMVHAVEAAADGLGLGWLGGLDVVYRNDAGAWQTVSRPAFRALVRDGAVTGTTPVLDLTHGTAGALRAHGLERPAAEAWTGRAFGLASVAA